MSGFNWAAFASAVDLFRESRGLEWKDVAEKTGVASKTLHGIQKGKRCDVDAIAALRQWMGVPVDRFFTNGVAKT